MAKKLSNFKKLENRLAKKPGIYSPGGLAAKIGTEKLGKAEMLRRAKKGREKAHGDLTHDELFIHGHKKLKE
jgi:hypothetical protein